MTKSKDQRAPQGAPGPPGPRGPSGRRGPVGARGERGKAGERGTAGQTHPANRATLLSEVNDHLEDIYQELDVQLKRMSQIQQQVDELRAKLKTLLE